MRERQPSQPQLRVALAQNFLVKNLPTYLRATAEVHTAASRTYLPTYLPATGGEVKPYLPTFYRYLLRAT